MFQTKKVLVPKSNVTFLPYIGFMDSMGQAPSTRVSSSDSHTLLYHGGKFSLRSVKSQDAQTDYRDHTLSPTPSCFDIGYDHGLNANKWLIRLLRCFCCSSLSPCMPCFLGSFLRNGSRQRTGESSEVSIATL